MRRRLLIALALCVTSPSLLAEDTKTKEATAAPAEAAKVPEATAKSEEITLTNKVISGKKTWLPAETKVHAGSTVELTLINTLDDPHGFTAPGVADPIVVGAHETKKVTLHPTAKGNFKFSCQLHPAHVGGTIHVL